MTKREYPDPKKLDNDFKDLESKPVTDLGQMDKWSKIGTEIKKYTETHGEVVETVQHVEDLGEKTVVAVRKRLRDHLMRGSR